MKYEKINKIVKIFHCESKAKYLKTNWCSFIVIVVLGYILEEQ